MVQHALVLCVPKPCNHSVEPLQGAYCPFCIGQILPHFSILPHVLKCILVVSNHYELMPNLAQPCLCPSTTWDYYLCTQGMRIPDPLYHEDKIRKMVKKLKKYRLSPEACREQELHALVEMPTSGYMLTCCVLGQMMDSQCPQRVTK